MDGSISSAPADAVEAMATGIAVVLPKDWSVLYANPAFARMFAPAVEVCGLAEQMADVDLALVRRRLEERGHHAFEMERKVGARTLHLEMTMRALAGGALLIEARDASRRRQAELMLDSYSRLAEKNLRALEQEKARVERLLLNVMPRAVLQEMREFGTVSPQRFEAATVLMLDFVDFSEMAIVRDPAALVAELNDIFSAFDRISEMFGCERIKTNGDSYMAVSGMPEVAAEHAANVARASLRMRGYLERRNNANTNRWRCRIGIATGPLVGSIVGVNKYVYDIFGPAVNLAARLERVASPMQILVAQETVAALGADFRCEPRDVCKLKGFGDLRVHELVS
ncbi:MAG: adenylate/guanylate cyclase domain-containing protein [Enhydrobacter sp.]|nr:MAG: adenylate/guanylate cyclase domain-containing protein [Enhydrobacter sp.]